MRVPKLLVVIGLAACGRASDRSDSAPRIPVERDGTIIATIPVAATDLWRWCDDGATAVVARSTTHFVHGLCTTRDTHRYTLARAADGSALATLVLASDGSELARAQAITSIRVITTTPALPALPPLTVRVAGRAPLTLDDNALAGLAPERRAKTGVLLGAIVAHVGVAAPRSITIRGATEYKVDPAWLSDPARVLSVRRNNRGELRFADEKDESRTRVSAVTEIVIE